MSNPEPNPSAGMQESFFNFPGPTLGGKQLWTDHHYRSGWRIQKNALTGHYRLLNPANSRRAWGTFDQCLRILRQQDAAIMAGSVVLLLHGLMRSRNSMRGMAEFLQASEFTVANIEYASTRDVLRGHAAALKSILEGMPHVKQYHFVCHSLGSLVVRRLLQLLYDSEDCELTSRMGRMVMLGPPNNGAGFAQRFKRNQVVRLILGKSGGQLGKDWQQAATRLATPTFEFGVIAGSGPIPNPLLDGESDLVVSVAETRLVGASDFLVVPASHTFMMNNEMVRRATLNYLRTGSFRENGIRCPIEAVSMSTEEDQLSRSLGS